MRNKKKKKYKSKKGEEGRERGMNFVFSQERMEGFHMDVMFK